MTDTVLNVPSGTVGSVVTEFGNYLIADGQVTVDSRAVSALIGAGFTPAATGVDADKLGAIPAGGTTGQQLTKVDGDDYDCEWAAAS